jgi:hypothetical protein
MVQQRLRASDCFYKEPLRVVASTGREVIVEWHGLWYLIAPASADLI